MDKLTEIPQNEWPSLRELYRKDWPSNIIAYYTIDNYIKWFEREPDIKNIKVYALNGDWSDGTYVIVDRNQILFHTLNENHNRLITALSLLDYSTQCFFHGYMSAFKPSIDKFIQENNLNATRTFDTTSVWYYLSKEDAMKFEISLPEGITLKSLKEEHAIIANDEWRFRHEGSLYFLKRLIRLNPSLGAFTKDNELVAWCLRLPIGSLGVFHVKESHRRKGLGILMVKAISKLFAMMSYDIVSPVVEDNFPSRNIFDKLGFKIIDKIHVNCVQSEKYSNWKDEYDM